MKNGVLNDGRMQVRVCKFYAKKGLCTKLNCEFSHANNTELI